MRPSVVALTLALLLPLPGLAAEVVVKPGETLSEIAERNGVSLSRLMELNGIRNADHVEEGQRLRLPGGGAPTASRPARSGGGGSVVVQPGETLSEIAEREGLSVARLMQINGLQDADLVQVGQTLRLRGSGGSTSTAAAAPSYPRGATSHTVRAGESLSQIAEGYGVPVSRLVAINGLSDPNHLVSGSRLRLSGPAATAAKPPAATAPVATPRAKPAPTTTTTASVAPARSMPARSTAPARSPVVAAATAAPTPAAATARSDWRSYGPLQVDWANWQPMGGSYVAPTLNRDGAALYTAINCGARKLNATTPAGQWKSWDEPRSDDEQQLVRDLCSSRSN